MWRKGTITIVQNVKGRHDNNNVKEWFSRWWNKTNKKTKQHKNIVIKPKKDGAQGEL